MKNLTQRQKEVLAYLVGYIKTNGYAPSCEVISAHFGWASPNAAWDHLRRLETKGYVRKTTRGYLPVEKKR